MMNAKRRNVPRLSAIKGIGLSIVVALCTAAAAQAAEVAVLTPATWDGFSPRGKEVDAIYGDYVLRNDQLVVVIARPIDGRNANMTVRNVGGCVIDLTRRDFQSDQLSAYYPEAGRFPLSSARLELGGAGAAVRAAMPTQGTVEAPGITIVCANAPAAGQPRVEVRYTLKDGQPFLLVETTYTNGTDKPVTVPLADSLRADKTFSFGSDAKANVVWVYDHWFNQAYGFMGVGHQIVPGAAPSGRNSSTLHYEANGQRQVTLKPGDSHTLARRLIPGKHLFHVAALANELAGVNQGKVAIEVTDPLGPVTGADIALGPADKPVTYAHTDSDGRRTFRLPRGAYELTVSAQGRGAGSISIDTSADKPYHIALPAPGFVSAEITSEQGGPIPCKVQFKGRGDTRDPFFFVDSGEHAVQNLYYSHTGRFRQALAPGQYDVIVSYGPEFDAVFTRIDVEAGKEAPLRATLVRSVDTTGWISTDFHSHSSPSGDNTTSQLGRVLNLLCEHIEFAPCTEHNRIDSYVPHLQKLGVEHLLATCPGIELTGSPLPVNHQNAFPLVRKPHTQDGGGPLTDADPKVQIERLSLWDDNSDKLVQQNHPNIVQVFFDKNLDGKPDDGFGNPGYMDVIEVHPLDWIVQPAVIVAANGRKTNNPIVNWMQLFNLGFRIPGVVNTDAHYNFHGSGWLRNFVKSPTDDPAEVKALDVVHAAEHGHIIMSTGPFMQVLAKAQQKSEKPEGTAGDDVIAPGGRATLFVRVQCPNWFDVDRVQVFINGRADPKLNFTRKTTPDRFSGKVVKFAQPLGLALSADAHVIVAAIGENSTLGDVMGPQRGKGRPVAVSNPIFIDVDGNGFKANGDMLGTPLPIKAAK